MHKYKDRKAAGIELAGLLKIYKNNPEAIVLALPRGGVPVAYEVANQLNLKLDIFLVRKIGYPFHEELALGAIASGGHMLFNEELLSKTSYDETVINNIINKEKAELTRRESLYRGNKQALSLHNKIVIVVDDGIATGASIKVALKAIRMQEPQKIIVAIPVAPQSSLNELESLADEIICPLIPENFNAVGLWYEDFQQTTDTEVIELLEKNKR